MAPTNNLNNGLVLEEPLIRTPYELLRRSHRSAQRQVEKDYTAVQTGLQALLKSLGAAGGGASVEQRSNAVNKLTVVGERVAGLKRKLDDLQPSPAQPNVLRTRVVYLENITRPLESKPAAPLPPGNEDKLPTQSAPEAERESARESKAIEEDVEMGDSVKVDASTGEGADSKEVKEVEQSITPVAPLDLTSDEAGDKTLDRYIVDYLFRTGRINSAKALIEKQGLDNLVDMKLFAELVKIEKGLIEKHSVAEALAWCGENRGTLKKTKNDIEFILRLQEFIELCRARDTIGAIAYSRKHLANWAPTHMTEIQQGMTLLAFGEKTGVGLYRRLYDRSRWQTVRAQFRDTFLSLYGLPSQPLLSLALSAGLSSLRLPSCVPYTPEAESTTPKSPSVPLLPAAPPLHNLEHALLNDPSGAFPHLTAPVGGLPSSPTEDLHEHPELPTGNVDCPTCGDHMKVLAKEVAMSHHVNSTLVCRISGEVMDSQNEPLAFPNGYVYSSKALAEMAKNSFDVVTCPRTRESCAFGRLRKVYIS